MKAVVSINVGPPQNVHWKGRMIRTGIFKAPVKGPLRVHRLNLEGDGQADLRAHGGWAKAVYAYPAEHYPHWQREYPNLSLPWGMFGENLTTRGLLEDHVYIGDRFRIGTVELVATQPRLPCYKLSIRFGREDMVKRFLQSNRPGIYFSVVKEGTIDVGNPIELVDREQKQVTIPDIVGLYVHDKDDIEGLFQAVAVKALPEDWRTYFMARIETLRSVPY